MGLHVCRISASCIALIFGIIGAAPCTLAVGVKGRRLLQQAPLKRKDGLQVGHLSEKNTLIGHFGFDEPGMDKTVLPGDNFFNFANGKYISGLNMPEDQSSWGTFDILAQESQEKVKGILEADMKSGGKMGKFYASFMNKSLVDSLDTAPIKDTLAEVAAIKTAKDYATLSGRATSGFLPSPFGVNIGTDSKDVNSYCVTVDQGGLGLSRDYYLKDSFKDKKAAYQKYAAKLLTLADWPEPEKAAKQIIELEDKIANASMSNADMRDPVKTYNPMASVEDLQKRAPGFDFALFLKAAGDLPGKSKLVVGALSGVIAISKILGETDIGVLRSHTAFHFLSQVAPILSARFVNAAFEFSHAMSGQKKLSPRWKRGVSSLNGHMGDAVGQAFVAKYFPAESKAKVQTLTQDLKKTFKDRLSKVDWMEDATKKKALNKLASFDIQVGYPKKFRKYDILKVDANDLYGNTVRAIAFDWDWQKGKLGTKVDKDEWAMGPQTVNAYNQPVFNQVVFPAAILQPPFFDPDADMAVNFGGIGAVIGHEMTHGFDDQGRHFDAHGKLEDWWTEADSKAFQKRADAYGKQFAAFDLGVPGAHIKPDLTMGEDIADLGGLTMAHEACMASLKSEAADVRSEASRRVFLGWAQVWREKSRPDALLNQLVSDPHPPAVARVDIPTSNIDAWYKAFDVKPGQKNFLEEKKRVVIW